jgi:alpha-L-rhamnosidase
MIAQLKKEIRADAMFAASDFSWVKDLPPGRNQFVSFERRFVCTSKSQATLHLFADTRYRLFVNGEFVAYGPGRFVTAHPEYDTHDLTPLLRAGENLLRVEVNYYGCSSFQTMPDGMPGFIAAGGTADGGLNFATPGDWLARIHQAWDANALHFSFAQNPAEICDTRELAAELAAPAAHPVVALPSSATPWPKPQPRSVSYPDYALVRPSRILVAGPVADTLRWGVQLRRDQKLSVSDENQKQFVSYATWIHSPRAQIVSLDCFWTDLELNGQVLKTDYPGRLGNHGEARIALRDGWNFLAGKVEIILDQWPLMLGLPRNAGATLHALPDLGCAETIALSSPQFEPVLLPCPDAPADYALPAGWTVAVSDLTRVTPARLAAWESPAADAARDVPFSALDKIAAQTVPAAIWSFDFGDEYYGQPVIEVEAPAGSVLDIAYDDWKRADGCVNLYNSNPFTDAADRFILHGGRQRIEVLNPRGGIYLQIVLRAPANSAPTALTVHDVAIRRRTLLNHGVGTFSCGDPVLDWAWRTSVHTLQTSTDEAYADCPWRERGSYIGDSLVNFHLNRLLTHDLSSARRTFENFGRAQLPDGQLACCAPSWLTKPHEDFTLIWIQAVRDFWAYTGDTAFVGAQWPVIQRIFASPTWKADADGLWDTTGLRVFLDWGVLQSEREGTGNAAVNILRVAALRATAELASALGHENEAARFTDEAKRVVAALMGRLWNETDGRFNASVGAITPALHANILALRYGIGPADRLLAYLEPLLQENFRKGRQGPQFSGYAELYFFYYLLPALVAHDRVPLAEKLIQEHYGFLKSLGYPTLTEGFHAAEKGHGSCCHSWSGSPAIYATEFILGLRLTTPGQPDHWILNPMNSPHRQAEGTLPHSRGLIRVSWKREAGRIVARASVPPGVTLTPAGQVELVVSTDSSAFGAS